tara:strand:- start:807 stop:1466 length:660 start_codon:yes stop_codon:yes gene_type:complete
MSEIIQKMAVFALPLLLAITLHEAAHAYAAKLFGDFTAFAQGRMSLNPIVHIDLIGTILIPLLLVFSGSPFVFGYAKPVPVNFSKLRNPKKHMAIVALAGPAANLLMAFLWMILIFFLKPFGISENDFLLLVAKAGVLINLVLFAFNLFPILPLDGGRIMYCLLPSRYALYFARIEPYGFFIMIGLMLMNLLQYWMKPVMFGSALFLNFLIYPIKFLLN